MPFDWPVRLLSLPCTPDLLCTLPPLAVAALLPVPSEDEDWLGVVEVAPVPSEVAEVPPDAALPPDPIVPLLPVGVVEPAPLPTVEADIPVDVPGPAALPPVPIEVLL